jgi:hypothetical protein
MKRRLVLGVRLGRFWVPKATDIPFHGIRAAGHAPVPVMVSGVAVVMLTKSQHQSCNRYDGIHAVFTANGKIDLQKSLKILRDACSIST